MHTATQHHINVGQAVRRHSNYTQQILDEATVLTAYPNVIWDAPPGGAITLDEFLSVRKLPTFCPEGRE